MTEVRSQPDPGRTLQEGFIATSICLLLGVFFLIPQGLVNLSYDLNFRFRPDIPVEGVLIIYMDVESHRKLGQDEMKKWDRKLHAQLIDQLAQAGARAAVFDVVFEEGTNTPAADAELVRAARECGRVIVATSVEEVMFQGRQTGWTILDRPFPELEDVARLGLLEWAPANEYIRRHHAIPNLEPSQGLGWVTARMTGADPPEDIEERWLNYYGPPGWIPHTNYWRALTLTNAADAHVFSNKVVFVGSQYYMGTTGSMRDEFRTPYTRWENAKSPGAEINATTYLNFVRGDWLERTSITTELLLFAAAALLLGFGLAPLTPLKAAGIGLALALGVGVLAYVIVWEWAPGVWFPWMIVSVIQIPAAVGWSALVHSRRLTIEKRELERRLREVETATPAPVSTAVEGATQMQTVRGPDAICVPDYELVKCIGEGAYGEVYLGRDMLGIYHAVKVVHRRYFREAAPFEREFNGLRRFTPVSTGHPSLVNIQHVGRNEEAGYIYYVMELADDESSASKVDPDTYRPKNLARELKRAPLSVPAILELGIQIAEALDYLHGCHLIHRDIKPANIIFVKGRAKLADIGLVTQTRSDDHTVSLLGTQGFMPPEGPGTLQADVYSLGKVLYQAVTGLPVSQYPDLPTSLMQRPDADAVVELNEIVLSATAQDPAARFQTAGELAAALKAIAG